MLNSFEPRTIQFRTADGSTYGMRYYGGGSDSLGRYLFPTFPDGRSSLALPADNLGGNRARFQLREGAAFFSGRAGPNFGHGGGGVQYLVPDLDDLVRLR